MEHAHQIDTGNLTAREVLPYASAEGLLQLGAPFNKHGGLVKQAQVLQAMATHSLSIPFTLWGHRMVIEFLELAGGTYADSVLPGLHAGTIPGASAMAPGYTSLAGMGKLNLQVIRDSPGALRLSGKIGWASNLYEDAIAVAPAYGPDTTDSSGSDGGVIVAFPLDSPGITIGPRLDILAMRGTASTWVTLDNVEISETQILTQDFTNFLRRTRPTLSILQASLCLGLATASYRQAQDNATGVHTVVRPELMKLGHHLSTVEQQLIDLASRVGTDQPPKPREVLAMRLDAGQLATQLATVELKTAGGQGFITSSDTNRRYREATFIPLQAPTETQLRWELSQA